MGKTSSGEGHDLVINDAVIVNASGRFHGSIGVREGVITTISRGEVVVDRGTSSARPGRGRFVPRYGTPTPIEAERAAVRT